MCPIRTTGARKKVKFASFVQIQVCQMANEIGRNIQRFFVKVEESITENKRCKLCSKSVNDNAAFLQLERLKFMFFLSYSPSSLRQHFSM